MSRFYLSFDSETEREEMFHAINGWKYKSFIDEFDHNVFRRVIKYGDVSMFCNELDPDVVYKVVEQIREAYWKKYREDISDE